MLQGQGEVNPGVGPPVMEGEYQPAVRSLENPVGFSPDRAQHGLVLGPGLVCLGHRASADVVVPARRVRQEPAQPDTEEVGQVTVLHTVEVGRVGDNVID